MTTGATIRRAAGVGPFVEGPEPFFVELERFRGPLDLLLHLIRSQDIDIFDIPIAQITRQFQRSLDEGLARLELGRSGEFLEMAATLVRIKAQLLLPRSDGPEWEEDPRSELVRRLLEYEHFHDVSRLLAARESERGRHFAKGYVEPRRAPATLLPELRSGREDFLAAVRRVPEREPDPTHLAPVRQVTVEEKVSLITRLVRKVRKLAFEKLYRPWGTRDHAVASLLACLELARRQMLLLRQAERFGPVWLFRGPALESPGGAETTGATGAAEKEGRG